MIGVGNQIQRKGISSSAIIKESAVIGEGVDIGDFSMIGENVSIGDNCIIGDGVVLGARPFVKGSSKNKADRRYYSVIIEDDCYIGSNSVIQYGVNRETRIGENCWINNICNIGHDVEIGEGSVLGLSTTVSGHSTIGCNVLIGPGCTLTNRSEVGDKAIIGIGSLVLHQIEGESTVMGRPAELRAEHLEYNKRLRKLVLMERSSKKITAPKTSILMKIYIFIRKKFY